ncbi:hypothetical protein EBQ81_05660 [bacterium]|nr:hypothetical protein [bacterium]
MKKTYSKRDVLSILKQILPYAEAEATNLSRHPEPEAKEAFVQAYSILRKAHRILKAEGKQ